MCVILLQIIKNIFLRPILFFLRIIEKQYAGIKSAVIIPTLMLRFGEENRINIAF